jgi:hypothetical protein
MAHAKQGRKVGVRNPSAGIARSPSASWPNHDTHETRPSVGLEHNPIMQKRTCSDYRLFSAFSEQANDAIRFGNALDTRPMRWRHRPLANSRPVPGHP